MPCLLVRGLFSREVFTDVIEHVCCVIDSGPLGRERRHRIGVDERHLFCVIAAGIQDLTQNPVLK
jgi:hypothetical protein